MSELTAADIITVTLECGHRVSEVPIWWAKVWCLTCRRLRLVVPTPKGDPT